MQMQLLNSWRTPLWASPYPYHTRYVGVSARIYSNEGGEGRAPFLAGPVTGPTESCVNTSLRGGD